MRSKTDRGEGVLHRVVIGIAVLCVSFCMLALGASSALADRTFDSIITPFNGPTAVDFDANGNVWISDRGQLNNPPGQAGLYKYNPYPSRTLLAEPNTYDPWQYYSSAFSWLSINPPMRFSSPSRTGAQLTSSPGTTGIFLREWSSINGTAGQSGIHIAIDNSNTFSRGRVYLSLESPEDDVEILDAAQRPVDFPATASYIDGNLLTGTPSGSFGDVQNITVDSSGNIYVTDAAFNGVVDEFDSAGLSCAPFQTPVVLGLTRPTAML